MFIMEIGALMSRFIFFVSSFMTGDEVPGLISISILICLAVSILFVWKSAKNKLDAIQWLENHIKSITSKTEFAMKINVINREAKDIRSQGGYDQIGNTWKEFNATLIRGKIVDKPVIHNTVRPSNFFNLEDLHFGPGFSRYMPGLFVTVGLFLTFLGLISALQQITGLGNASPEKMRESLDGLLGAVSAKFIMSLTGLLASIVFTVFLRYFTEKIERHIHMLCIALEKRLVFVSLEQVAMEQLEIIRDQKESLMAIPESISTSMSPLLNKISKIGVDGVEQMVNELSSRLSDGVSKALSDATVKFSTAGDKIETLSERMDQSSSRMGQEMESSMISAARTTNETLNTGAEKFLGIMNETLNKVERNTAENTDAMKKVATDMCTSAKTLRDELASAINDCDFGDRIDDMVARSNEGSNRIKSASSRITSSEEAIRSAIETHLVASWSLQNDMDKKLDDVVDKMDTDIENT